MNLHKVYAALQAYIHCLAGTLRSNGRSWWLLSHDITKKKDLIHKKPYLF